MSVLAFVQQSERMVRGMRYNAWQTAVVDGGQKGSVSVRAVIHLNLNRRVIMLYQLHQKLR